MWPFKKKNLRDALRQTKKLKLHGVLFEIKKISPVNYLTGNSSLIESFSVYSKDTPAFKPSDYEKIKRHYRDVFLDSVIKPKLTRDESIDGVCVDEIFENWELANDLYLAITELTYGKKKSLLSYREKS